MEDSSSNEFRGERELVSALLEENDAAFRFLAKEMSRRFLSLVERWTKSREDAEEVINDATLKIITKIGTFRPGRGASFWSWVYKIVERQRIDHSRRKHGQVPLETVSFEVLGEHAAAIQDFAPCVSGIVEDEGKPSPEVEALEEGLAELRERDREILELHFLMGLTDEEVARRVGIENVENVRKYRSRALQRLRKILERFPAFQDWEEDQAPRGRSALEPAVNPVRRKGQ